MDDARMYSRHRRGFGCTKGLASRLLVVFRPLGGTITSMLRASKEIEKLNGGSIVLLENMHVSGRK